MQQRREAVQQVQATLISKERSYVIAVDLDGGIYPCLWLPMKSQLLATDEFESLRHAGVRRCDSFIEAGFPELTTKELRKFWNHSSSIRALVFLFFFCGVAGILGAAAMMAGEQFLGAYVSLGLTVILFVSGVGLMKRALWGRILSFVLCVLALFVFPIGTIIGILSLMALSCGKLFGPERFVHRALDAELKHRKKNRVE